MNSLIKSTQRKRGEEKTPARRILPGAIEPGAHMGITRGIPSHTHVTGPAESRDAPLIERRLARSKSRAGEKELAIVAEKRAPWRMIRRMIRTRTISGIVHPSFGYFTFFVKRPSEILCASSLKIESRFARARFLVSMPADTLRHWFEM